MADQLALHTAAAGPDVKDAVQVIVDVDDDPNGENSIPDGGRDVPNSDEAAIIDEYFGLHDVTTTSVSGDGDVMISRAYDAGDAHWLDQTTIAPTSGSAVTSQSRLFASGERADLLYPDVTT